MYFQDVLNVQLVQPLTKKGAHNGLNHAPVMFCQKRKF